MRNVALLILIASAIPAAAQPPGRGTPRERPAELKVDWSEAPPGLIKNPRFMAKSADVNIPAHYAVAGDAAWVWCGSASEKTESGIALYSGGDRNKDGTRAASVTQKVTGFPGGVGAWYRFTFRGLAEPGFAVEKRGLIMRADFAAKGGTSPLDGVTQDLYPLIERTRTELAANGKNFQNGGAVWKTYALDFRLPFTGIDTLTLGVGFAAGAGKAEAGSEFYVTEFALTPIPPPADAPKVVKTAAGATPSLKSLIPLGGRWYYNPETGMTSRPDKLIVTAKNAGRLYYLDHQLSNPFAENMTAWLREGNLDLKGTRLTEDRFVPDNVVIEFRDGKEMIIHARNIPNHPTATFPGRVAPNAIQECDRTYYLPLTPTRDPAAKAMDATNANRALPMGPIGVAVNGVAFFNPFDAGQTEAVHIMDRCCGHPSPNNQYHYHKYPACIKTPFRDDGEGHSPLIGFALDGFPIYGPYISAGVLAKDATDNPLDAFNMRNDADHGWHYHVTPGKYPYIIGGFAGTPDPRMTRRGPGR